MTHTHKQAVADVIDEKIFQANGSSPGAPSSRRVSSNGHALGISSLCSGPGLNNIRALKAGRPVVVIS